MSYSYLETETDETIRHGDDDDQDVTYQEMLVKAGALEKSEATEAKTAIEQTRMIPLVCSCGSMRCCAIRRYGLPKPTFHQHIEPIGSQYYRDATAKRMKADGVE